MADRAHWENCAADWTRYPSHYAWNDTTCSSSGGYISEIKGTGNKKMCQALSLSFSNDSQKNERTVSKGPMTIDLMQKMPTQ